MFVRKLTASLVIAACALAGQPPAANAAVSIVPAGAKAGIGWFLAAFDLGPWDAYLAHELTPDLPALSTVPRPWISWVVIDDEVILPEFARELVAARERPPALTFGRLELRQFDLSGHADGTGGLTLERSLLISGIEHRLAPGSHLRVSAILARQQFSHSLLDLEERRRVAGEYALQPGYVDSRSFATHGAGVQFALHGELAPRLGFNAAYQSRINLDELVGLRGIHGASADLDIPSRMQLGLDLQATERSSLRFAVAQVFYSEVGAFPSRALPARFNALLGDSTSPEFNWNDLTVYSVGWSWRHESDLEFSVDFHTRSQPTPSAPGLARALDGELAQQSILVGMGKGLSPRARVQINASYAPPEFAFGGNVMGVVTDRLDQAVEVVAGLHLAF